MPSEDTQFSPGVSGNPGGRPRIAPEVRELAAEHGPKAFLKVIEIMNDPKAQRRVQLAAAEVILDRCYGKAVTPLVAAVSTPNNGRNAVEELMEKLRSIRERMGLHDEPTSQLATQLQDTVKTPDIRRRSGAEARS